MSVWIDPKDVEQQHRESLSYLGQRHKDRTERIPRDSATTKDQNGNILREHSFTKYAPLGPVLWPVNSAPEFVEVATGNVRISKQTEKNARTSQRINERNEQTQEPIHERPTNRTSERANDRPNARTHERTTERLNERTNILYHILVGRLLEDWT